jgi:hypothetical protein
MQRMFRVGVPGVLAVLIGCTPLNIKSLPEDADTLGRKGLVVAEVHVVGGTSDFMDVIVTGHPKGTVHASYYAAALPAGDYTLESLSSLAGGSSGGFGGVSTTTNYLSYPVNRNFTIRTGEVTNLGQLVLAPDRAHPQSKQFNAVFIDNSADAPALLKTHYPELVGSLKRGALVLAPGDYVQGEDLRQFRLHIASVLAGSSYSARYVAGPAGTLARVERDRNGKPAKVQLIDSGVIAGLYSGAEDRAHDRFAYASSDGRLFVLRAGKIQQRPVPGGITPRNEIFLAGNSDVVIPTSQFTVYTSNDDGATWTSYAGAAYKPGEASPYGTYDFVKDAVGFFVYRSYPARMVYSPVGSPNCELVTLPKDATEIRRLTILQSDILLEVQTMAWAAKTPIPFYVRARSGGEWKTRYMPGGYCGPLIFPDATGQHLRAVCGQVINETADGGQHWRVRH